MANLVRWDSFEETIRLNQEMDQILKQWFNLPTLWSRNGSESTTREFPLAVDVMESENDYTVIASIPGLNPDDVEVTLTNNVLTIRGEVKPVQALNQGQMRLQERLYGRFVRSLTFPASVQDDQIEATYENGTLTLHVPKSEQAKPKRIAVKPQQVIEG
jgi:HSP20 family protein